MSGNDTWHRVCQILTLNCFGCQILTMSNPSCQNRTLNSVKTGFYTVSNPLLSMPNMAQPYSETVWKQCTKLFENSWKQCGIGRLRCPTRKWHLTHCFETVWKQCKNRFIHCLMLGPAPMPFPDIPNFKQFRNSVETGLYTVSKLFKVRKWHVRNWHAISVKQCTNQFKTSF
jgi:hypothetical protein